MMSTFDFLCTHLGNKIRKPTAEWCELLGVRVMDPDGWRGIHACPLEKPLTLSDFIGRIKRSTIYGLPGWSEENSIYRRAIEAMAAQYIHPTMTAEQLAKQILGE